MTVRSTLLGAVILTTAHRQTVYKSIAGWRTIVKSVIISNNGTAAANIELNSFSGTSSNRADLLRQSLAANAVTVWNGWYVLNPTDNISILSDQPSIAVWASGTLLLLTGAEPVIPPPPGTP